MSQFRDLIARMAIDAEFARHARANPDAVARQYGLTGDETEQLRGLADAAAGAGPTALGARLSKSGGTFGGVVTSLAVDLDLTPDLDPQPSDPAAGIPDNDSPPPADDGGAGGPGPVLPAPHIDLSGIGPISLEGGDAAPEGDGDDGPTIKALGDKGSGSGEAPAADGEGDGPTVEAMPQGAGDSGPAGDGDGGRTYEALGDKGSGAEEPPAAEGDGESGSGIAPDLFNPFGNLPDTDDDGIPDAFDPAPTTPGMGDDSGAGGDSGSGGDSGPGGDSGAGLGGLFPWSDNDGDGLPNMVDTQPDNPDTTGEPYGDNDGDGQINLTDPTPDGMPTVAPGIDLSELVAPRGPDLPGGFVPELNLDDLTTGADTPAADAPAPGEVGEPPLPPAETPSGDAPAETPGEPPADTAPGDTPADAPVEPPASGGETGAETGPADPVAPTPPSASIPDSPVQPDGDARPAVTEPRDVQALDDSAPIQHSETSDPVIAGEDDGGINDFAIGAAGLAAGAVAGGVAGAAAGKALGNKGTGQPPAHS